MTEGNTALERNAAFIESGEPEPLFNRVMDEGFQKNFDMGTRPQALNGGDFITFTPLEQYQNKAKPESNITIWDQVKIQDAQEKQRQDSERLPAGAAPLDLSRVPQLPQIGKWREPIDLRIGINLPPQNPAGARELEEFQKNFDQKYPTLSQYNRRLEQEVYGPARREYAERVREYEKNLPPEKKTQLENERKDYQRRVEEYKQQMNRPDLMMVNVPKPPEPGPAMKEFERETAKIAAEVGGRAEKAAGLLGQQMGPGFQREKQACDKEVEELRRTLERNGWREVNGSDRKNPFALR